MTFKTSWDGLRLEPDDTDHPHVEDFEHPVSKELFAGIRADHEAAKERGSGKAAFAQLLNDPPSPSPPTRPEPEKDHER